MDLPAFEIRESGRMQKPTWKRGLASLASVMTLTGLLPHWSDAVAQDTARAVSVPAGLQDSSAFQSTPIQYLPFAHFAIPFDIDRTGKLPQEVNLWVSADQGKSWLKYASNSPDKRSFEFQAAAEGEYLFAVQTQDDRGASALAAAPPMRILVDTTKPKLQLNADINAAGRLVIDYRIEDRFLSEQSIRLSYSVDGSSQWEEIRVGRLNREGDLWSGQIEVEMPRCHELELKLVASDLAQNQSETSSRYNAPRTASAGNGMQLASQKAPPKPATLGAPQSITPQLSGPRAAANRVSQLAGATPTAKPQTPEALESTSGAIAWEPNVARSKPVNSSRQPLGKTVSDPAAADDNQLNISSEATTATESTSLGSSLGAIESSMNANSTSSKFAEELPKPEAVEDSVPVFQQPATTQRSAANAQQGQLEIASESTASALSSILDRSQATTPAVPPYTPPQSTTSASIAVEATSNSSLNQKGSSIDVQSTTSTATVAGVEPSKHSDKDTLPTIDNDAYHSRSRSFSLDYSVESLRGLAIADIELWGTDDRGNTWQKWGSDPDRESPFDVQVGTDGLYGFRMVIIGQNGLVSNRPNAGDSADMWINVDTKIPSVKITRALYGEGPDAGMLVIDYSCDDENLHERPISLAYSERPTGPWSTIVTGLRNTGIYLWKADPNLPQQVYLRIQAADRAGNVQEHRLDLPINLRGLTPRGRIQGFRPIDPK